MTKIEKFEEMSEEANAFYNTWGSLGQAGIENDIQTSNLISQTKLTNYFPIVLIASKLTVQDVQTPYVAICTNDGQLIAASKVVLLCGR